MSLASRFSVPVNFIPLAKVQMEDEKKQVAVPSPRSPVVDSDDAIIAAESALLDPHGFKLFPQPVQGDALDPLNWTWLQKHIILSIVMALYV